MARRSPLNERYQKYTGPKGQTRKSAAAAKPKKAASSGGGSKSSTPAKGDKPKSAWIGDPKTPQFRAARKQWWIALGAGLVFTLIAISISTFAKGQSWSRTGQTVTLAIAYACIFFALYTDWTKMRPMRKAWIASGGKLPKPVKTDAEKTDTE